MAVFAERIKRIFLALSDVDAIFPFCLVIFGGMAFSLFFFSDVVLCDTIEHIRASLAVAFGLTPYVDFFEHHHPLLWYLFAPVAKLFYLNIHIIFAAKAFALLSWSVVLYLVYSIAKDLNGEKTAKLTTLFLIAVPYIWRHIVVFVPDAFMCLLFL